MRRFRRDQRDQPERRAARGRHPRRRTDSRRRPGRPWLVLLPGAVLSLVVVSALVAPGFGVVVTGRGQPRPPDLGGPILVPTVTTTATPVPSPTTEEPAPIGAPTGVSAEQTRQRYLRELAARMSGQETPQRLVVRPDDAPAVTYRPLPAATAETGAAPSPVPSEPGVTPVPSAPPRAPGRALPAATP